MAILAELFFPLMLVHLAFLALTPTRHFLLLLPI